MVDEDDKVVSKADVSKTKVDVLAAEDDVKVRVACPHSPAKDGTALGPLPMGTKLEPQSSDWAKWISVLSQSYTT